MKHAKFMLHDIVYPKIHVEANTLYKRDSADKPTEPFLKIQVSEADDSKHFRAIIHYGIEAESEADPYDIYIVAIGIFSFYDDIDVDKITFQEIAVWNGPAIVYSSIRDFIATITARNIYGSFFPEPYVFTRDNYINQDEKKKSPKKNITRKVNTKKAQ